MIRKFSVMLLCLFFSITAALAQTQVQGVVVAAEDDQPIVGATVRVQGQKNSTVTDINGNFTLNVPAGKKITVSYIGMESVIVSPKSNMRVVFSSDDATLGEVVVNRYAEDGQATLHRCIRQD